MLETPMVIAVSSSMLHARVCQSPRVARLLQETPPCMTHFGHPSLNIEPCRMLVSPQSTGHSVGVRDPRYHSQQLGKLHPYS